MSYRGPRLKQMTSVQASTSEEESSTRIFSYIFVTFNYLRRQCFYRVQGQRVRCSLKLMSDRFESSNCAWQLSPSFDLCVCVCVCVCVRACVRACVCVCVCSTAVGCNTRRSNSLPIDWCWNSASKGESTINVTALTKLSLESSSDVVVVVMVVRRKRKGGSQNYVLVVHRF